MAKRKWMGFTQKDGKGGHSFAASTMTAAQQAETDRLIQLDKDRHNFGGTGINGDIANLGLAAKTGVEPQYTGMGGNIGGMGGGSPPIRPTPVGGPTYRADVPVTPGVVTPQGLNGDIVDLGFNASATGIEPLGMGGQGHYSGGSASSNAPSRSVSKPDIFSDMTPTVEDRKNYGQYGGPVERAQPHIQKAGAISEPSPPPERTGQASNLWSYGILSSGLPSSLREQTQAGYVKPPVVEPVKHETYYAGTPQAGRSSFSVFGLDEPGFLDVAAGTPGNRGKPGFSESSVQEQRRIALEKKIAKAAEEKAKTTFMSSGLFGGYDFY